MKGFYKFGCAALAVLLLFSFCACASPPSAESFDVAPQTLPLPVEDEPLLEETFPLEEAPPEEIIPLEESNSLPLEEPATEETPYTPPADDHTRYEAICAKVGVNLRSGAGTAHEIVGYMRAGSSLPYIRTEGNWHLVCMGNAVAYVSATYTYKAETTRAVERVVEAGLDKLGAPYVWGAPRIIDENGNVSPYFTGKSFDCSSFVQYCYFVGDGVKLGNYTGSQADYTVGKKIYRYEALERGDFYFTGSGSISHVVIYMGGGYLLQAYSASGGPVSFTTDDRWRGKFISGRRVDFSVKDQYAAI